MSSFVAYYFNSDKGLQELSDEINECLGTSLKVSRPHYKEQAWCMFFGMSMDFWAHSRDEEDLLDLEKQFKYQIGLVGPSEFKSMRLSLLGMLAYLMYHRLDISSGSIVYEMVQPLTMYERRIFSVDDDSYENLFDTISGKEVEMPQHLMDLALLIEE